MARIPLSVQGVTCITASSTASLLVVTDMEAKRQISIVIDNAMHHEFDIRRGKHSDDREERKRNTALLEHCLPETMSAILKYLTDVELAVVITTVYDGQYRAVIEDSKTGTSFIIRASDGILLSYADPHIPLYIEESLWNRQSLPFDANAGGIAIPLNTLSPSMLKKALEKCIEEENYEMAEKLKNELKERGES